MGKDTAKNLVGQPVFRQVMKILPREQFDLVVRQRGSDCYNKSFFSWDQGSDVTTHTSQELLRLVTYPVAMHELINSGLKNNDRSTVNLFTVQDFAQQHQEATAEEASDDEVKQSRILKGNSGYGFIQYPPNILFFHYIDVLEGEFDELMEGDMVEFIITKYEKGQDVAKNVRKVPECDVNVW